MRKAPSVPSKPAAPKTSTIPNLPSIGKQTGVTRTAPQPQQARSTASSSLTPSSNAARSTSSIAPRKSSSSSNDQNARNTTTSLQPRPATLLDTYNSTTTDDAGVASNDKESASDAMNEIDDFEHRLVHGANYSSGFAVRKKPSAKNSHHNRVQNNQQQQNQRPVMTQQHHLRTGPITVEAVDEGEETDTRQEKKRDIDMVRNLPGDNNDSDSD